MHFALRGYLFVALTALLAVALHRDNGTVKDGRIVMGAVTSEPVLVEKASAMLAKLNAQNRFALAFRTDNMKTEAGRKKKIADLVAMLKRGETIYPQKVK